MTRLLIDYSAGRPRPAAITAAGYHGVCRYLGHSAWKRLTPDEAASIITAGLDLVVVWETTADRALSGNLGGLADGAEAALQAGACRMPAGRPIFYAVDFDAQPAHYPAIAAYLTAAAAASGRPVGVYGSHAVCTEMAHRGAARYVWQTAAWSHKRRMPGVLYQRIGYAHVDGVTCDVNEAPDGDFGSWHSGPVAPAPTPDHEDDDDVKFTMVMRKGGDGAVFITDGVKLVKGVPNTKIRDTLQFFGMPAPAELDGEFFDWLARKD